MKKKGLLFLLATLHLSTVRMAETNCHSQQIHPDLTCFTDYDCRITCIWNSEHMQHGCTNTTWRLHARRITDNPRRFYSADCDMEPGLKQRTCLLGFKREANFQSTHVVNISLRCSPTQLVATMNFTPFCHIKLHPPTEPNINTTTVSWFSQKEKSKIFVNFDSELQWKRRDEEWKEAKTKTASCKQECSAELPFDLLLKGETYEARVRVQPQGQADKSWPRTMWSEWGPISMWQSSIGVVKPESKSPTMSSDLTRGIVVVGVVALVFGVFLNNKIAWVYKKIKSHPSPDPAKSSLKDLGSFKGWWSSPFTAVSLDSSLNKEDIVPVEIISPAKTVQDCSKDAALLEKIRSESRFNSNSSCFSNPSYSHLCTSASKVPPNTGTQQPGDGDDTRNQNEEQSRELLLRQLLSCSNRSDAVEVVSDYEKVEKRDQDSDSMASSVGQVCQDSLEAERILVAHEDEEEPVSGVKSCETDLVFQKLFGVGVGNVFGTGSVLVCSDYEKFQRLEPSSPELPSLDSGVSCEGEDEEQLSHEESPEDLDLSIQSTIGLSSTPFLPCVLPAPIFHRGALRFSPISGLRDIKWTLDLTSVPNTTEPSSDGYMPVKQE